MDSKCTHKKDSLHVFWMLRVIYKKTGTEPAVFFKTEPKPNLKNPFRTSLQKITVTYAVQMPNVLRK